MFIPYRIKLYGTIGLVWATALPEASAQIGNNNNNTGGTAFFARVDPTGFTVNGGTGISGVTQTNLTENTAAVTRNFFAAGGIAIDPQPLRLNQVVGTPGPSSSA